MSGAVLRSRLPEGAVYGTGSVLRLRVLQMVVRVGMGVRVSQAMRARRWRVDRVLSVLRVARAQVLRAAVRVGQR